MVKLQEGDLLGDAYEYLIGQFAMESSKKARGVPNSSRQIIEVMAQIVAKTKDMKSIYDLKAGSRIIIMITANSNDYD